MSTQLPNGLVIFFLSLLCLLPWLFSNWHIRLVFVVTGMNLKGSYKRNLKRYRKRWTILQRWLLLPIIKESKFPKTYKFLFIMNWLQLVLAILIIIGAIFFFCFQKKIIPLEYCFYSFYLITIIELAETLIAGGKR